MNANIVTKIALRLKQEINLSSRGVLSVAKAKRIIKEEFGREYLRKKRVYSKKLGRMKSFSYIPKIIREEFRKIMGNKMKYSKLGKYWKKETD